MLNDLTGLLGSAGGSNFIQQINDIVGLEIGTDSSNVTV